MHTTILYQAPFCPFSRKLAFGLQEKNIFFKSHLEKPWKLSPEANQLSIAGELPILSDGHVTCPGESIACAYIDDAHSAPCLSGSSIEERIHIRRMVAWFEKVFYRDIYKTVFYERILKSHFEKKPPNSQIIRSGLSNLQKHLITIDRWCAEDSFIVGKKISWADIAAAANISCLDYILDTLWDSTPFAKRWYMKIKSRPSFRPFLKETIPGIQPSKTYSALDF